MDDIPEKVIRLAEHQNKDWRTSCLRSAKGKLLSILHNAVIAIRMTMSGLLAYDEMLRAPLLMKPLDEGAEAPRPVTDVDAGLIQTMLQNLGLDASARTQRTKPSISWHTKTGFIQCRITSTGCSGTDHPA